MLGLLGWVIVGALAVGVVAYWDRIKNWLNTIVADKIEQIFGYGARQRFHHAVSIADMVAGRIRNRMFVYVGKKNGQGYDKYLEKESCVIGQEELEVAKQIQEQGCAVQEFQYVQ